ncbi:MULTISPECIES: hypothetical protein [Streptomyces]|uniref:hypothetical protein n=1 Tax=Streptomyces TaxID=1883 RepID=UPI001319C042|nr:MULTISPECIES: hypothetical protein [Streptomyces]MYT07363.1 hypothetical protein [Streptomyces sp. SID5470]
MANEFYYIDPLELPIRSPAHSLCNEKHSFSRIFSAAFLDFLAGVFSRSSKSVEDLQQAANVTARILCQAASQTPVSNRYWSDMAANMLLVDMRDFGGEYESPLRESFSGRGVLLPGDLAGVSRNNLKGFTGAYIPDGPGRDTSDPAHSLSIDGEKYGVIGSFEVGVPRESPSIVSPRGSDPVADLRESKILAACFVDSLFMHHQVEVDKGLTISNSPMPAIAVGSTVYEIFKPDTGPARLRQVAFA